MNAYNADTVFDQPRPRAIAIIKRLIEDRDAALHECRRLERALEAREEQIRVLLAANRRTHGREADRYE
jgi:hypothetical protein